MKATRKPRRRRIQPEMVGGQRSRRQSRRHFGHLPSPTLISASFVGAASLSDRRRAFSGDSHHRVGRPYEKPLWRKQDHAFARHVSREPNVQRRQTGGGGRIRPGWVSETASGVSFTALVTASSPIHSAVAGAVVDASSSRVCFRRRQKRGRYFYDTAIIREIVTWWRQWPDKRTLMGRGRRRH